MKIKFVKTFRPAGQAKDIPTYTAGETYTIADDYARKYIKREFAVEAKDEVKAVEPVAVVEEFTAPVSETPPATVTDFLGRRGKRR